MKKQIKGNFKKSDKIVKDDLTMLPFVRDIGKGKKSKRSFWHTETTGDYSSDWQLGEKYGMLLLEHLKKGENTHLLGWCVDDMHQTSPEDAKGIKLGFLSFIARAAIKSFISPAELYGQLQIRHNETRYVLRNM